MKTKKMFSKVFALLLTVVMMFAMSISVFAQTVPTAENGYDATKPSITIRNAANGETYKVYKIFDATYNSDGSISYTIKEGKSTDGLPTTFKTNTVRGVTYVSGPTENELTTEERDTLASYVTESDKVAEAVSDGSQLIFGNLEYGYYLITTSQGKGIVSIDSTNPKATVEDKNTTTPIGKLSKTDDKKNNVNVGETITYTIKFTTSNYTEEKDDNGNTKQIVSYKISDPTPTFLKDVKVTSIIIGGSAYTTGDPATTPQFDKDGDIIIPWVDSSNKSIYANGAEIVITYTAVVTEEAAIAGKGNTNTVTITYTDKDGGTGTDKKTDTVYTYAIAIQKVTDKGKKLDGATFSIAGVTANGSNGVYTVTSTAAESGKETVMETNSDGLLIVKGFKSGEALTVTEVEAPDGYNKVESIPKVTPQQTTATSTTFYIDETGKVIDEKTETSTTITANIAATAISVVNSTGSELPSTGGIGTTIFYVVGSILVIGAAVALIVRKRMSSYQD